MKTCLLSILLLTAVCTYAQKTKVNSPGIQLKLYNIFSVTPVLTPPSTSHYSTYTALSTTKAWNPSFAVNFSNKKGNQHEIELTAASFNVYDNRTYTVDTMHNDRYVLAGNTIYETYLAARYEYILKTKKNHDNRINLSVGLAASPYYLRHTYIPYTSSLYPAKQTYIGTRFFVTPHFVYHLSQKMLIDINIPICAADFNIDIHKEQDPAISLTEQSVSTTNLSFLPAHFTARLGIGVKL